MAYSPPSLESVNFELIPYSPVDLDKVDFGLFDGVLDPDATIDANTANISIEGITADAGVVFIVDANTANISVATDVATIVAGTGELVQAQPATIQVQTHEATIKHNLYIFQAITSNGDYSIGSADTNYATARAGLSPEFKGLTDFSLVAGDYFSGYWQFNQVFWAFNTSALPPDAVIGSIELDVMLGGNFSTTSWTARIRYADHWSYNLSTSEFINGNDLASLPMGGDITVPVQYSGAVNDPYTFELDGDGISLDGTTGLVLYAAHQESSSVPAQEERYAAFWDPGSANAPVLFVVLDDSGDIDTEANTANINLATHAAEVETQVSVDTLITAAQIVLDTHPADVLAGFSAQVDANTADITLTGVQATIDTTESIEVTANTANVTLDGVLATISAQLSVDTQANTASIALATHGFELETSSAIAANTSDISIAGQTATIETGATVDVFAVSANIALATIAATITTQISVETELNTAAIGVQGQTYELDIQLSEDVQANTANISLAGHAYVVDVGVTVEIAANTANITATGIPATVEITQDQTVAASPAAISLTGQDYDLYVQRTEVIESSPAGITLVGIAGSVTFEFTTEVTANTTNIHIQTHASSIDVGITVLTKEARVVLHGGEATITYDYSIDAVTANIQIDGQQFFVLLIAIPRHEIHIGNRTTTGLMGNTITSAVLEPQGGLS